MKTIFTICFIFITAASFSQKISEAEESGVVGKAANINMFHNAIDLEKLNKSVLMSIDIKRLEAFLELSPFMAFHSDKGKTMSAMGIPSTKTTVKLIDKLIKEKIKFEAHLAETLTEIGGYSEKQQIIDSIILLENMLGDIRVRIETQNNK